MTGKPAFFHKTATSVHSMEEMADQRFQALALDQCALSGGSLYGQVVIGISF